MDCYARTMSIIEDRQSGDDYQLCRAFSDMKSDLNGFTDYLQLTPAMFYGILVGFFVVEVILMHINTQISKPPFGERWKGFWFPILIFCLVMALPLSKVMNATAFCVMNPFDDFCHNLDFECLDILRKQSSNAKNPDLMGSRNHDYGEIIGNVQHELPGLNPQVSNVICFIALPVGSYFTIENVSIIASDTNFIRLMDWINSIFMISTLFLKLMIFYPTKRQKYH